MNYRTLSAITFASTLLITALLGLLASPLSTADSLNDMLNKSVSESSSTVDANPLSTPTNPQEEFNLDDIIADEIFLTVEEAYKLTVSKSPNSNGLTLNWIIADKYFLYGDKFKLSINNKAINANLPVGVVSYDQIFERDVEKHYHHAKITIDQDQLPKHPGYELSVGSQGCADAGLCYPPQTERFKIGSDDITAIKPSVASNPFSNNIDNNTLNNIADSGDVSAPKIDVSLSTIATMILFALLGGMILNLMPCVLPVLSLKALSLAKSSNNHRKQGWSYALGAITTFVVIAALLLAIRAAGHAVGWGFQLQSPGFVTALFYLFFVMGLSLSGFITIGARWMSAGQSLTQGTGNSQSYFTGVLAAVVASPCTAPFMAPALGFAITQPWWIALTIFASLGLGMALPLLLLSYIPSLNKLLPKPGAWMETFKQALAFPLYITAIWLLWVLSRQLGPNTAALVILGGLGIIFIYWLGQKSIRFSSLTGVTAIALIATLSWSTSQQEPLSTSASTAGSSDSTSEWEAYDEKRLAELRNNGEAVFINLTADWCITCLANEKVVFTASTLKAMKDNDITLIKGDWTNYDPEITKLLEKYKRGGVPLYLLFPAEIGKEPKILPQLLTPSSFKSALNDI